MGLSGPFEIVVYIADKIPKVKSKVLQDGFKHYKSHNFFLGSYWDYIPHSLQHAMKKYVPAKIVMMIPSRLVVFFVIVYADYVLSLQCIKKNLYFVKNGLLNPLNQDGIVLLVLLFELFFSFLSLKNLKDFILFQKKDYVGNIHPS